jgi:hypothetical protein
MNETDLAWAIPATLAGVYWILVALERHRDRRRGPDLSSDEYRTSYRNGQRQR